MLTAIHKPQKPTKNHHKPWKNQISNHQIEIEHESHSMKNYKNFTFDHQFLPQGPSPYAVTQRINRLFQSDFAISLQLSPYFAPSFFRLIRRYNFLKFPNKYLVPLIHHHKLIIFFSKDLQILTRKRHFYRNEPFHTNTRSAHATTQVLTKC